MKPSVPALLGAGVLLLAACARSPDQGQAAVSAPAPTTPPASSLPADTGVTEVELLPDYDALDQNKDGIVTLPEVVAVAPQWAERVRHCDANGDQQLSREEYAACKP